MVTLATDDFNRANETPVGGNWTTQNGESGLNLSSSHLVNPNDVSDFADNYNAVTWPNDHWSQVDITCSIGFTTGDGPGVGLRMSTSAQTYYRILANHQGTNNVEFSKKVAGSFTALGNRTQAYTDGATWYGEIQGTTLIVKLNGVQVSTSASDSAISSGRAGLVYSSEGGANTVTWDNWSGGDFAAAGPQDTPELYGRPDGLSGQRTMTQLLAQ